MILSEFYQLLESLQLARDAGLLNSVALDRLRQSLRNLTPLY